MPILSDTATTKSRCYCSLQIQELEQTLSALDIERQKIQDQIKILENEAQIALAIDSTAESLITTIYNNYPLESSSYEKLKDKIVEIITDTLNRLKGTI